MGNIVYLKPFSGLKAALIFIAIIFLSVAAYLVVNQDNSSRFLLYLLPSILIITYLIFQNKLIKNRYIKISDNSIKVRRYALTKEFSIPINDILEIKIINSRIAIKTKDNNQIIINLDWVSGESKQKSNKLLKNIAEKYNFDFSVISFTDILKKEK